MPRSFFTCDTGGDLNKVTHMYSYRDLDAREEARQAASANPAWAEFVAKSRAHVVHQVTGREGAVTGP